MSLVFITGASSGIGLETAKLFLEQQHTVVNLSRRDCPLEGIPSYSVDLLDTNLASRVGEVLLAQLGEQSGLEIHLVHNASLLKGDTATNTEDASLVDVMQVNVIAPNVLNRSLIPRMGKGSSITFVGSTLSEKAVAGSFTYVTSKHAQIGMMRSLCQDLKGRDIHTSVVCPGFTDTPMLRSHVGESGLTSIADTSTFGRIIRPIEIAETIYWVTQNPVINGSVIHANLGQIEH